MEHAAIQEIKLQLLIYDQVNTIDEIWASNLNLKNGSLQYRFGNHRQFSMECTMVRIPINCKMGLIKFADILNFVSSLHWFRFN